MVPATANFLIKTNGYWDQTWQILNNGVATDLTGYTFEMSLRSAKSPNIAPLLTISTGSGITVSDPTSGNIQLEIPPMPSILVTTVVFYDLLAISNGKWYVWIQGKITLDPGATYETD